MTDQKLWIKPLKVHKSPSVVAGKSRLEITFLTHQNQHCVHITNMDDQEAAREVTKLKFDYPDIEVVDTSNVM